MSPELAAALSFGLLAAFLLTMAVRKGFFAFPSAPWVVPIRFIHVIWAFAIYFITSTFVSGVIVSTFRAELIASYMTYVSWLNFSISLLIFALLVIYMMCLPSAVRSGILRRPGESHPFFKQLSCALYAWLVSFPLVLAVSQVTEAIVFHLFKVSQIPDQMAVRFLKSTFDNPMHLLLAIGAIVVLAPLVEETLFRGFLQTYIRRHLGSKQAILITSCCFALFHYAAGQGFANIPIICSLFVLAVFLGFLYEKQGTIVAPMLLHASFNGISVINLYLFGGFSTGL